jgi:hypothetical protein
MLIHGPYPVTSVKEAAMKTKKKLLVVLQRSSDSSEVSRTGERLELPATLAGNRIWCPTHLGDTVKFGLVLPGVYEWTFVPGPDETQ